jgi:hypothetical protein
MEVVDCLVVFDPAGETLAERNGRAVRFRRCYSAGTPTAVKMGICLKN